MINKQSYDSIIKKKLDPNLKELLDALINRNISQITTTFYSAKVVDNKDPLKMKRCRVRVFGIHDFNIPDEDLPWAIQDDAFLGSLIGSTVIPPIGALVRVYFEDNDLYSPVYTAKLPDKVNVTQEGNEDYPDTMVFIETDNGDYFKINRKKNFVTFHAAGGALITIDNNGAITIDTTEVPPNGGENGKVYVNATGDIHLKSATNVIIETPFGSKMWQPNILPKCLFTGAPHSLAGINSTVADIKGK